MGAPLLVQINRFAELCKLLEQMNKEYDMKKFFELDRRFKDIMAINKLEDEINDTVI